MISTWPLALPTAVRDGHGYEDQDGRSVTDMTSGPPRLRRLFRNTSRRYRMKFHFTRLQLRTFENYYNDTLGGGVKPTYVPVLDELGYRAVPVLILDKGKPQLAGGSIFTLTITVQSYDH